MCIHHSSLYLLTVWLLSKQLPLWIGALKRNSFLYFFHSFMDLWAVYTFKVFGGTDFFLTQPFAMTYLLHIAGMSPREILAASSGCSHSFHFLLILHEITFILCLPTCPVICLFQEKNFLCFNSQSVPLCLLSCSE